MIQPSALFTVGQSGDDYVLMLHGDIRPDAVRTALRFLLASMQDGTGQPLPPEVQDPHAADQLCPLCHGSGRIPPA